jgi:hypothetical protein
MTQGKKSNTGGDRKSQDDSACEGINHLTVMENCAMIILYDP